MRRILFVTILMALVITGRAQQDAKARGILEKVTKTTQSLPSLEAAFTFEMNNKAQNIHEKNEGTIILKGKKYKLNIPNMGIEITCDGKTIWTYMVNSNEVNVSNLADQTDELMDPSKIFTIYEHGFDYKFVNESVDDGVPVYVIDLNPQKPTGDVQSIRILIDKQKNLIRGAYMTGKDGNKYTVAITKFKTDGVYSDADFVFDPSKHKGVDVVDMR